MANALKGEVAVTSGDKTYTLVLSINALCELEEMMGQPTGAIIPRLQMTDLRVMRALMWAGLRQHHPDVTLQDAGRLLLDVGLADCTATLHKALERAFPSRETDRPLGEMPSLGTGQAS